MKKNQNFNIGSWKSFKKLETYFKFDTFGATFKKEIIGGVTTFLALIYIFSVHPEMLSHAPSINSTLVHNANNGTTEFINSNGPATMNQFGVFIALCISSFAATFAMGLFANIPVAVAPSMGINVMFTYNMASVGGDVGIGYEGALIATTISSVLFVIFSITPLRKIIISSLPESIIVAIGIGIGFFVAYVGLQYIGWFKLDGGVPVASMSSLKDKYPSIILGMGIFCLMLLFHFRKVNGGVAISLLIGLVIALIIANSAPDLKQSDVDGVFHSANFVKGEGWNYDFAGFASNIKNTWKEFTNVEIWNKPIMYISIFIFLFLNFFDATGTLTTFNNQLNAATGRQDPLNQASLVIDSGATVVGSVTGTSPLGAFVESGAGIQQGARTGFAAIVTSVFFLVAIALFPIFKAVPMPVSGAACLFVGVMMISNIMDIEWKKPEFAISAFLCILFMITTYTIANGIGIAIISYTIIKAFKKEYRDINPTMWILPIIFIAYFVAYAFIQGL